MKINPRTKNNPHTARLQKLAGIKLTENFNPTLGTKGIGLNEPREEELNEEPANPAVIAAGAGLTIAFALKTIIGHYKQIKKADPSKSTKDAILDALTKTGNDIQTRR